MIKRISLFFSFLVTVSASLSAYAAEAELKSPDGSIAIVINTTNGLSYHVTMDGKPVLAESKLGMRFESGLEIGPTAEIINSTQTESDTTWQNHFGKRLSVRDHYTEMRLDLKEDNGGFKFGLICRAYDNGVAFRYDLPEQPGFSTFVVIEEVTQFNFADNYRCWGGEMSNCVECHYPEQHLLNLTDQMVLPLLVELPQGYVAIAESDLIDWGGLFLRAHVHADSGHFVPSFSASLSYRKDGHGCVVSQAPRHSPWRVLMLGRTAADLLMSDLIENLATPSQIDDISWIKPGISAWDPWWAGGNGTRGTTEGDKPYIDLAAEMGWPYQLVDWGWYKVPDVTQLDGGVDVPQLQKYGKDKGVNILLWMHNHDLNTTGVEKAFSTFASWGVPGLKIDFMESDSQEMVNWYYSTLQTAAKYKLMIDFHGAYKPTGLARTWPNYITQEGVLGNEYNKYDGRRCNPAHQITLPFTRGLLGPMDFTPGGFVNRSEKDFVQDAGEYPGMNTEVIGTRARQLALTVIYESPLLCLCDSPTSYRGQTGVEFLRGLPTVWDDTVVPSADVARQEVVARRSGNVWYLAAMNTEQPTSVDVPLSFLGKGQWTIHSFADNDQSTADPTMISEATQSFSSDQKLTIKMAPVGGYVAVISPVK